MDPVQQHSLISVTVPSTVEDTTTRSVAAVIFQFPYTSVVGCPCVFAMHRGLRVVAVKRHLRITQRGTKLDFV
ncbi:hypothetical protein IG631_00833 [Alternaria alternata]|jgi:hypothetical protein|nr:hypothetical protein IG631_00833 [Alternaria alternata]